ncbi:MAG: RsmB/NOP family class I SAM-dependent RNA methyltransferase [Lentisphaerae bacterium]|nr:RsmB/NOP family class I SAM-dependent RNA methyltransferase [Lentisphaerota bacterium]
MGNQGNTRTAMPLSRLHSQAKACAEMVELCLCRALLEGAPADRSLRQVFYANRQLGSRDRRLISETLFAVLRWWGWLRQLAPKDFQQALEDKKSGLPENIALDWSRVLVGAWLLESPKQPPEALQAWIEQIKPSPIRLAFAGQDEGWQQKSLCLKPLFTPEKTPELELNGLLPDWVLAEMEPAAAADPELLLNCLQKRPPLWFRAQVKDLPGLCRQLAEQGVNVTAHAKMPEALRCLESSVNLHTLESFKRGHFEIQDLASQNVALICDPKPGQQWWDACAGAGGKTLHLAFLMQGKGSVTASDIRKYKLDELKLRARRASFPNIRCKHWKGKQMPVWNARFDGVLVDAPCSCSGTWRRNPDARWTSSRDEIADFVALQKQLLQNAAPALKPGGVLVYATCSMFQAENQGLIHEFLRCNPDFELSPFVSPLDQVASEGMRQIWHWQGDCDAMFVAKLKKRR